MAAARPIGAGNVMSEVEQISFATSAHRGRALMMSPAFATSERLSEMDHHQPQLNNSYANVRASLESTSE